MTDIKQEFSYETPEQVHYRDSTGNYVTLEYTGPEFIYVEIDKSTGALTGRDCDEDYYESFEPQPEDSTRFVKVDCSKDTLLCELFVGSTEETETEAVVEEIPGNIEPFEHEVPILPYEIYDVKNIKYDTVNQTFIEPFPWQAAPNTWEDKISDRDNYLASTDKHLSEDLPSDLYKAVEDYRKFMRDMPEIFGAAWSIEITNKGSGYQSGDKISINDPRYKNSKSVNEILLEVTETDSSGGIISLKKITKTYAYSYHPEAGEYSDVFFTTNNAGQGASIKLSKIKTVDPWKINYGDSPLER